MERHFYTSTRGKTQIATHAQSVIFAEHSQSGNTHSSSSSYLAKQLSGRQCGSWDPGLKSWLCHSRSQRHYPGPQLLHAQIGNNKRTLLWAVVSIKWDNACKSTQHCAWEAIWGAIGLSYWHLRRLNGMALFMNQQVSLLHRTSLWQNLLHFPQLLDIDFYHE